MEHLLPILLDPRLRTNELRVRVHGMRFRGIRNGVGHAALDTLRGRVREHCATQQRQFGPPEGWGPIRAAQKLCDLFGAATLKEPVRLLVEAQHTLARGAIVVENDAEDLARLLGLFHGLTVFALDAAALRPPLNFQPCPSGYVLPTPRGPLLRPGIPVLADSEKVLRSLQYPIGRARPSEVTTDLLVVVVDPTGRPPETFLPRFENWVETLLGGRRTACRSTP